MTHRFKRNTAHGLLERLAKPERITFRELIERFDPSVHEAILTTVEQEGVHGVILFENVNLSSPNLGDRTAVIWGPGWTYQRPEDAEGKWLHDLPSQRQYPTAYCQFGELEGAEYSVLVGNIGEIKESSLPRAIVTWLEYKRQSDSGIGRAAGEPVALLINGEPAPEFDYPGTLAEAEQD